MSRRIDKISQIRITRLADCDKIFDVSGFTIPEERLEIAHQLALDVCRLKGISVPEPGTQRHVVRLIRKDDR
jgi:hypothetical protein